MPKVSIITPVYNQERYVAACIESVLAQTDGNWEQIIIDDGSDDRTQEIVSAFADPRIRYLRLPHRGLQALGETYNHALAASRGELIAILEGDDLWPARKLELQLPVFDDPDVLLSWGRAVTVDASGEPTGRRSTMRADGPLQRISTRELFRRLHRSNVLAPSLTVMVRRSALERIGGFQQTGSSLYVDLPTWLHISAACRGDACFIDQVLGEYRVHEGQTTHLHRARMSYQFADVIRAFDSSLPRSAWDELGWDDHARRAAEVSALMAESTGHIAGRAFAKARRGYGRALVRATTVSDRARAALGLLSAMLHVDLLGGAFRLRERWLAS